MEKTMKIEGMMCGHCEARVKKSLEALDGVSEAAVSHESGTAVVKLSGEVSDAALTKAVEDMKGNRLLLFTSDWAVRWAETHNETLKLSEFGNI